MATLLFQCDLCHQLFKLHGGSLSSIPFGRMPQLVLDASNHRCPKKKEAA